MKVKNTPETVKILEALGAHGYNTNDAALYPYLWKGNMTGNLHGCTAGSPAARSNETVPLEDFIPYFFGWESETFEFLPTGASWCCGDLRLCSEAVGVLGVKRSEPFTIKIDNERGLYWIKTITELSKGDGMFIFIDDTAIEVHQEVYDLIKKKGGEIRINVKQKKDHE